MGPPKLKSPCINVCEMSSEGYCRGCWRTIEEIARWMHMSHREQKTVLDELGERARWAKARET
jgi:uncharacterized protein